MADSREAYQDIATIPLIDLTFHKLFPFVEVVYERKETQTPVNPSFIAAIDIGVNNLVALTSNKGGFTPQLVNGETAQEHEPILQ